MFVKICIFIGTTQYYSVYQGVSAFVLRFVLVIFVFCDPAA